MTVTPSATAFLFASGSDGSRTTASSPNLLPITFTTASASYPSTHGSIAVNDVSKQKFNYSGSGFTGAFGVGDAALLHCNGTGSVQVNAEL